MADAASASDAHKPLTDGTSTTGTPSALANPHTGSVITTLFRQGSSMAAEHASLAPDTTLISSQPEWQAITTSLQAMLDDFKTWAPQHGLKERSKSPHLLGSTIQRRLHKGVMSRRQPWLEHLGALDRANEACTVAVDWKFARVADTFELSLVVWGDVLRIAPTEDSTDEYAADGLEDHALEDEQSAMSPDLSERRTLPEMGEKEDMEGLVDSEDGLKVEDLEAQRTTFKGERMWSWWKIRVQ